MASAPLRWHRGSRRGYYAPFVRKGYPHATPAPDTMKVSRTAIPAVKRKPPPKGGRKLSALVRAERLGENARRAGFDWADIREVLAKVREETAEIEDALDCGDLDSAAGEIGDLMLAIANAPRFIGHRAEATLARACGKFAARFSEVERIAAAHGRKLKSMRPAELDSLWNEAKRTLGGRD
ncbi:MAG: hypothetical protein ACREQI_02975 [Candidatus Binataceae bacterium]